MRVHRYSYNSMQFGVGLLREGFSLCGGLRVVGFYINIFYWLIQVVWD